MAPVVAPAENATELMSKLTLDAKTKTHDAPEVAKKYGSAGVKEVSSAPNAPPERSLTPLLQEYMDSSNMCYLPSGYPTTAYYYGGYDGSMSEWEDYPRYVNHDGVEMPPPPGSYSDMYHHGYGYAPYGAYPSPGSPVPTVGPDGQLYGPQHYPYSTTYYQPQAPQSTPYTSNQAPASQGNVSTSTAAGQPPVSVDTAKAKSNGIANATSNGSAQPKVTQQNPSPISNSSGGRAAVSGFHPSSGYQDQRFGFDRIPSPIPWFDPSVFSDGQHSQAANGTMSSTFSHANDSSSTRNQNLLPVPNHTGSHYSNPAAGIGSAPGFVNRMYPNNQMYAPCGTTLRTGLGFGSNVYDSRTNGRWGVAVDSKYRPRGRNNGFYSYNNENSYGLNELNRGPRAGSSRNQKGFESTVTIAVKGQSLPANGNVDVSSVIPDKDQFNLSDFPVAYSDAKFFIIKSYSEDDVHKSVKYNVWASTPNGNKKLDAAYKEKSNGCPIFLFFSVNTSGQFVGIAEMVGPVDFNKTVEFWQQDKWTGCFPVKWHIVKDVPNNILKHITLENNENKPVTNSRDTQEVKLEQGLQMLKLFKEHVSKTSILDDFSFYETRQNVMQERRAKQQQIQKQVVDIRPKGVEDIDIDRKLRLQNPLESVTLLKKEAAPGGLVERKPSNENGIVALAADVPKVLKPAAEKCVLVNGVANGR